MTTQRSIRASDQDREIAAGVICEAYAAGCLDRNELEQRSGLAYSARTLGELQDLTADLPAWLQTRPVPLPHEYCYGSSPSLPGREWRTSFTFVIAGFWLIVATVAWVPLLAVPLTFLWILLALCARSRLLRSSCRSRPRLRQPEDPGKRL